MFKEISGRDLFIIEGGGERKILFGNFLKVQDILSLVFTMELRTGLELVR